MRIGVPIFPGANCDRDALFAVEKIGATPVELPHTEADLRNVDAVIVPGGFTYGDYLRPGAIARFAKVMSPLEDFANSGGPVLGVCNGFQILTEARLLPGALLRNSNMKFICRRVGVWVESADTPWTVGCEAGEELTLPVAHNEGNYYADAATLAELEDEGRVVLRYVDNPNGSANGIAGVCNTGRNVVGMMPHPERASDAATGFEDGLRILRSILGSVGAGV